MYHRPALYLLTVLLSLATAVALAGAAFSVSSLVSARTSPRTAEDVVHRFYAAANEAIATGEVASLNGLLAPDYVEREPLPGLPPDRDGLLRHLRALHAVMPDLRVDATAVVVDGDEVMARVAVRESEQRHFLGLPADGQLVAWGPVDRFRVVGDLIVERWAAPGGISVLEPLQRGMLTTSEPIQQTFTLEQQTFDPWTERSVPAETGVRLVAVETGRLSVHADPASAEVPMLQRPTHTGDPAAPEPVAPGTSIVASAGDMLALPEGGGTTLRLDEGNQAIAFVLRLDEPHVAPDVRSAPPSSPDLGTDVIAGEATAVLSGGSTTVAFGRIALAPGATISLAAVSGPQLFDVESGTVEFAAAAETVWVRSGRDESTREIDDQVAALAPGDGAFVADGAGSTLTNTGSDHAIVQVVTLTPGNDGPALAQIEATWRRQPFYAR